MLYGTITEFCTEDSCPIMSAGPKYEYHWADGHTVKKPIKCSAPKYIDYLMTWVQDQLDDETLFPSKIGANSVGHRFIKVAHCCFICRCTFPKELPVNRKDNIKEAVQSVRAHLPSAL